MAKKVAKNPESRQRGVPSIVSLSQVYPSIARWASGYGWVKFGIDGQDSPFVGAEDEGGTVWEGEGEYQSLEEALGAMEAGLTEFLEEEGFNERRGGSVKEESLNASPERPKPRKKAPPKTQFPKRPALGEPDQTAPVPRAIAEKVRRFSEIAEALRDGQNFPITRLTSLKGLCKDPRAARSFALFLAVQARKNADDKGADNRIKGLMDGAISGMESYLQDSTEGGKAHLHGLLRELEREQDEYRQISWGRVRVVRSMELVVVENALKSILLDHEAPAWLYQAARDYAERYDSRYGTGLIPASAPIVQAIADFWRGYFDLGRGGETP